MQKTLWLIMSLLLLTACTISRPTVIEPTVVTPTQTQQVTKIQFPTLTATQKVIRPTSTPIPYELARMNPVYFDGIVVITQYLTYLDLGLYQEAYRLLHPEKPNIKSEEDFILGAEMAYQSVEIKTIQPYFIWAKNHGLNASGDPENQMRYFVEFTVEGVPGWWPNNDIARVFVLSLSDGKWKIFSQDSIAKK